MEEGNINLADLEAPGNNRGLPVGILEGAQNPPFFRRGFISQHPKGIRRVHCNDAAVVCCLTTVSIVHDASFQNNQSMVQNLSNTTKENPGRNAAPKTCPFDR
ncbi:hypothetical protein MLD38_016984 [Melastoma candidum]|uniref:Uncharacterized protein n=1 Tax=Melastoma candidum TaxID=119954 RepID=A0ACB9QNJ3_9MYRT|nr:hypothetical protein MLD38_016984 [Melastoma candidum]